MCVELNHDKIWQESGLRGFSKSVVAKKPSWTRYCLSDFMHTETSVMGLLKPCYLFLFLRGVQKLSIKPEHLDKFRSHTEHRLRLGNDKMDAARKRRRSQYNRDIHFDYKLYFSLCTFTGSIIGQIVPVVCMCANVCKTSFCKWALCDVTLRHWPSWRDIPSPVALWGRFSLPVEGILVSPALHSRIIGQIVVVSVQSVSFTANLDNQHTIWLVHDGNVNMQQKDPPSSFSVQCRRANKVLWI